MGEQVENGDFGFWMEGDTPFFGAKWAQRTPARHEFIILTRARTAMLAQLALLLSNEVAWIASMAPAEQAWFNAQPPFAQRGMWRKARNYVDPPASFPL